ncbi:MAG: VOC family protein [Candidatus Poribacteria bacterium]|nr:VOC family protein [Candidatus Poribacteria bacterium]
MAIGTKNSVIHGCGAHHIAVQTRDWDVSLNFYKDVLGMEVIAEFGSPDRKIVLLDMGDGSHMELFQPTASSPALKDASPNDPVTHFALATTDARAAVEQVRQAGGEVTLEPTDVDLGNIKATIAFFKGPSGEVIEFFETH